MGKKQGESDGTAKLPVNRVVQGDALAVLRRLPGESVDTVITSPPYWGLRVYGTQLQIWGGEAACRHRFEEPEGSDKEPDAFLEYLRQGTRRQTFCTRCGAWRGELGLEPTLDLYVEHLGSIFREVLRVLKPSGTCWVNLGDSYAGSHNGAGDRRPRTGLGADPSRLYHGQRPGESGLRRKSLCQAPSRFALEMCRAGWLLRNEIIWWKPNCMPSSAKDRFTVDFERLFFFVKNERYWFETQYEEFLKPLDRWGGPMLRNQGDSSWDRGTGQKLYRRRGLRPNPEGRQMRCVWRVPTRPFPEAHFAVYPPKLVETPIRAGCPEQVCRLCGAPRGKIFEGKSATAFNIRVRDVQQGRFKHLDRHASREEIQGYDEGQFGGSGRRFVGWSDPCGCGAGFEPGVVLDPFLGSGTTAVVALELGRRFVGVELNPKYVRMARRRIRQTLEKLRGGRS